MKDDVSNFLKSKVAEKSHQLKILLSERAELKAKIAFLEEEIRLLDEDINDFNSAVETIGKKTDGTGKTEEIQ